MKEWQINQYRELVEEVQSCVGRELTQEELNTIEWLAGTERKSISTIMSIIKAANEYGKRVTFG